MLHGFWLVQASPWSGLAEKLSILAQTYRKTFRSGRFRSKAQMNLRI